MVALREYITSSGGDVNLPNHSALRPPVHREGGFLFPNRKYPSGFHYQLTAYSNCLASIPLLWPFMFAWPFQGAVNGILLEKRDFISPAST